MLEEFKKFALRGNVVGVASCSLACRHFPSAVDLPAPSPGLASTTDCAMRSPSLPGTRIHSRHAMMRSLRQASSAFAT